MTSISGKTNGRRVNARQVAIWVSAGVTGLLLGYGVPAQAAAPGKHRVSVTYPSVTTRTAEHKRVQSRKVRLAPVATGLGPALDASSVMVVDFEDGKTVYGKNSSNVMPIASITKLMTAMVVLDAGLPMAEPVQIEIADFDFLKFTHSRLGMGTGLTRRELLRLALMSSENRAAAALGRAYPGGVQSFVAAMNRKAADLGMARTRFVDSTGLSSANVSTAQDLVKMVRAAYGYELIREFTTTSAHQVESLPGHVLQYGNSNRLVRSPAWEIGLSKTGYIRQAGGCLVMQARIAARPLIIVLLDASNKQARIADADRLKRWLENTSARLPRPSLS